jgi:tetratricopeptide (TPR) repeat protein
MLFTIRLMGSLFGRMAVNVYGRRNMNPQELKETGHRLFNARQYAAALPLLKSASEAFPNEELLWQELVLAAHHNGQHEQAVEFAKQGIRQHPRSGWLWNELGNQLTTVDRLDEAKKALDNAGSLLGYSNEWLWRHLAALHRKRKNPEKEVEALENLDALGAANWTDLNQLGVAYHNLKDFAKALEYYQRSAATESDAIPFFNMGLVFNDPEVSQDADAADAFRRALAFNPDYGPAKERLEATKRKMIPLALRARTAADTLVQSDEFFQFYLSPFEMLQIMPEPPPEDSLYDEDEEVEAVEEVDVKAIQRAKKKLLQEIDLNDGMVAWLDNCPLDKSRALAIEDELHDETKRRYHCAVFLNKPLLGFLTRGDLQHFLHSDDYFPDDTLELLDGEPEFRAFLSKRFAQQYNLVLTRAIERRLLPVVEVLFDGRRWVKPEDEDICFHGAYERIDGLVETMRSKANEGRERKVSLDEMEECFRQHSLPDLFNLLPTAFASRQREIVEAIRSLAISCFNEHNDSHLAKGVLNLCKRFTTRSEELTKRLEEDFKTVERMIAEENKHSFLAWVRPNVAVQIGKAGIAYAGASMSTAEIEAIRWGVFVQTTNGIETAHLFLLEVRSTRLRLPVNWGKRGILAVAKGLFRKPGAVVSIAELSSRDQEVYFQEMIDAAVHHLLPPLMAKLLARLQAGQEVIIGPCTLSDGGIRFRTGRIFKKDHLVQWKDAITDTGSGYIFVSSRTDGKAQVSMSAMDTENAVILPIICAAMREQSQ